MTTSPAESKHANRAYKFVKKFNEEYCDNHLDCEWELIDLTKELIEAVERETREACLRERVCGPSNEKMKDLWLDSWRYIEKKLTPMAPAKASMAAMAHSEMFDWFRNFLRDTLSFVPIKLPERYKLPPFMKTNQDWQKLGYNQALDDIAKLNASEGNK